MRYPAACVSTDIMGLLPFSPSGTGTKVAVPLDDNVPWEQFYEWQFRVKSWRLDLAIAMDPATVAMGAPTTAVYSFLLTRPDPFAEGEYLCLRPGVSGEALSGTLGPATSEWISEPLEIPLPGDDYFSSISWSGAVLSVCPLACATRYTIDGEEFIPSILLALTAVYDDGSEGTFSLRFDDPSLDPFPPADLLAGAGSMDGIGLTLYAIGFNPGGSGTYSFGGVPPAITLTPLEWFEFRRSIGTEPILDKDTGLIIPGQTPYTNVL